MKAAELNITQWAGALRDEKPFYLAIIDQEGRLTFTNSYFYTTFQPLQSSGTHTNFIDLVHECDLSLLLETLANCAVSSNSTTAEIRIKKGRLRRVKWEISCVRKSGDRPERFLLLGYDIEGELLPAKRQIYPLWNSLFTSFMDHTPYFTWIVDQHEGLVFANLPLLEYFCLDTACFGEKLENIIPLPIARLFSRKHTLARNYNQPEQSIIKSLMADGRQRVFQVTLFPIHGAAPHLLVGGEALDITEAYNARQEERKASERLLYINKATSEAIWDWNIRTGQIYFNQILHDLIGTDLHQVFNLDWCFRRIHPEDTEGVENIIRSAMEKHDQSWETEYRFQFRSGQFKRMHHRGFIIYENGEAIRMIGSLQDVSEIRNLETQLVKQKLKQQKGIAEAIIQAQEQERTRIGHELHDNINQILTSGQLYLNLLDSNLDNFQEIKAKALKIVNLAIEEIRHLSQAMVLPDLKEEGLVKSIYELVNDLRFVGLFNIHFAHSPSADIEYMNHNKKITLFRIIQEQIKNIVKYSKAKNVEISLHCCNDQVRLMIGDDGKGFDPKTTRRGLGLSNIYERTRLYNGKILLTTTPGKGCSIIVNIPLDPNDTLLKICKS